MRYGVFTVVKIQVAVQSYGRIQPQHYMVSQTSRLDLNLKELTPRSRALLEKLITIQLVKKFPAFYRILRFITMFTTASHWSPS